MTEQKGQCWMKASFNCHLSVSKVGRFNCRLLLRIPTMKHDVIELVWTSSWLWHGVALQYLLKHWSIVFTRIREATISDDFIKNPK